MAITPEYEGDGQSGGDIFDIIQYLDLSCSGGTEEGWHECGRE